VNGCATDHETVAQLVAALRDIDGVTRVGLGNTSNGEASAGGGGAESGAGTSEAECDDGEASFDATVAFDGVAVDPATGGIVPEEAPPADDGGVAEAQGDQETAEDSVEGAQDQADQAVEYLPGA
jgi:hypothetical protein